MVFMIRHPLQLVDLDLLKTVEDLGGIGLHFLLHIVENRDAKADAAGGFRHGNVHIGVADHDHVRGRQIFELGDVLEHRRTIHKLCFDNRCNTLCWILQEMLER